MKPTIVTRLEILHQMIGAWKNKNNTIAFVPTMGALHEGHLALVRAAQPMADHVVISIFVNPKQFGAHEDLGRYPREAEADIEKLDQLGMKLLIFMPDHHEIYGADFATNVTISGPATMRLEDRFRPDFFNGVATVLTKLFILTQANIALFGEKDYQQLQMVRRLVQDLNMSVKIIGVPTQRDDDGLALSSRNRYLSEQERGNAPALYRALQQAAVEIRAYHDHRAKTLEELQSALDKACYFLVSQGFQIDYLEARHCETLALPRSLQEPLRLLAAVWLGKTRLIDNIAI